MNHSPLPNSMFSLYVMAQQRTAEARRLRRNKRERDRKRALKLDKWDWTK